jgi:hypothetical protein
MKKNGKIKKYYMIFEACKKINIAFILRKKLNNSIIKNWLFNIIPFAICFSVFL